MSAGGGIDPRGQVTEAQVRADLATKVDLSETRNALKTNISDLRNELKRNVSDLRNELKMRRVCPGKSPHQMDVRAGHRHHRAHGSPDRTALVSSKSGNLPYCRTGSVPRHVDSIFH
jgi:hypothetical protein